MTNEQIEQLLMQQLNANEIHIQGQDAHYTAIIVSDELAKLTRIKQQQAVYAPLMDKFSDGSIHALSIRVFSAEKWQRERALNGF